MARVEWQTVRWLARLLGLLSRPDEDRVARMQASSAQNRRGSTLVRGIATGPP
jgi:hypothetical protein